MRAGSRVELFELASVWPRERRQVHFFRLPLHWPIPAAIFTIVAAAGPIGRDHAARGCRSAMRIRRRAAGPAGSRSSTYQPQLQQRLSDRLRGHGFSCHCARRWREVRRRVSADHPRDWLLADRSAFIEPDTFTPEFAGLLQWLADNVSFVSRISNGRTKRPRPMSGSAARFARQPDQASQSRDVQRNCFCHAIEGASRHQRSLGATVHRSRQVQGHQ